MYLASKQNEIHFARETSTIVYNVSSPPTIFCALGNNNLKTLLHWGAPQKLDKNLIKLFDFEFGILPGSFLILSLFFRYCNNIYILLVCQ